MKAIALLNRAGPATSPLFREFARHSGSTLKVFYLSDFAAGHKDLDPDFNQEIDWAESMLYGYDFVFLKSKLDLVRNIKKENPDAVIVYGWSSVSHFLLFLWLFTLKIPAVLWSETPLNQEVLKNPLKKKIKKIIIGRLFKRISAVLYIGKENKEFYESYAIPAGRLFFSPYAVDNGFFTEEFLRLKPMRCALRKELNIGEKDPVVLFVGSLIKKKRPMDLLKAYQKLVGKYPDTNMIFVGDGALMAELQEFTRINRLTKVHFAGFQKQSEISKFYSIADVFVLPSGMGETWGLVVNEAMCFGLPVIVSDIVGSGKDLVRKNENGFIYKCGDIEEIRQYLEILVADPDKRESFGEKSAQIIKNYDYTNAVRGMMSALESIR